MVQISKIRLMLLGAGELGKEFVISAKRYGLYVIAIGRYENAPAMQVADASDAIDMLNPDLLDAMIVKHQPTHIIPEIESIRIDRLFKYEEQGIIVIPNANAVNITMDRKKTRDLATSLQLNTVDYDYASSVQEIVRIVSSFGGYPCVVKPLMSSSGKGQTIVKKFSDVAKAWDNALKNGRGDSTQVIVEKYIDFDYEITLLTATSVDEDSHELNIYFCSPIGHIQVDGDYRESWQPHIIDEVLENKAREMSRTIVTALRGSGIWGVEFLVKDDQLYFSELSPRPHDTGFVTMGSQDQNEFEIHLRAILGLPIDTTLKRAAATCAIISNNVINETPIYTGLREANSYSNSKVLIFGKRSAYVNRRMGVGICWSAKSRERRESAKSAKRSAQQVIERLRENARVMCSHICISGKLSHLNEMKI